MRELKSTSYLRTAKGTTISRPGLCPDLASTASYAIATHTATIYISGINTQKQSIVHDIFDSLIAVPTGHVAKDRPYYLERVVKQVYIALRRRSI
jgi:hypothetical protein